MNRVQYWDPTVMKLYISKGNKLLHERVYNYGTAAWEYRSFIYANGKLVAQYMEPSSGSAQTRYIYSDHLGSTTLILNETGASVQSLSYDAQGKRRLNTGFDDTMGVADWQGRGGCWSPDFVWPEPDRDLGDTFIDSWRLRWMISNPPSTSKLAS